jgi:hypothetical protein
MPATLAAAIADATATLKAENDRAFEQSPLSPAEAAIAAEIAPKGAEMWAMYRNALARARRTQDALRVAICKGVAPMTKREDGSYEASAAIRNYNVCRLIDDFCEADRRLYDAAQTLCDCLELADDGHEEGVEWSLMMAMRTRG